MARDVITSAMSSDKVFTVETFNSVQTFFDIKTA